MKKNDTQSEKPSVIIALGGNALSPKKSSGTIEEQFTHTRASISAVMNFVHAGYNICITHGNGPQVGSELMRNELTRSEIPPLPLGVLVANTEGSIGYMIQQSLQNAFNVENVEREVITLISQVVVDTVDPEIKNPNKFVGKRYNKKEADKLIKQYNWVMKEQDPGEWRRVVPSPTPQYIFNGKSVKVLVDIGTIVISGGGGGIPVYFDSEGNLNGMDAVIDKDRSAALLGRVIKAKEMFIITDVDHIYRYYHQKNQEAIHKIHQTELEQLLLRGHFQEGTMRPKIKAALYFLEHHGQKVVITSIDKIQEAMEGKAGTTILAD